MNIQQAFLAALVAVIWGLVFPVLKFGLSEVPPLLYSTLRFLISTLVLIPFFPFPKQYIRKMLILSATFGLGHFGLFFYGMSLDVEAGTASVLMQTQAPIAAILGVLVLGESIRPLQIAGLVLAFLGAVIIIGFPEQPPALLAAICLVGSAVLWAVSMLLMKGLSGLHPLQLMGWLSFFTTFTMAACWLLFEGGQIPDAPLVNYLSVFYPALLSTVVAYGLWNYLISVAPVSRVAPFVLLAPVVAIVSGVVFQGDAFGFWHLIGGALVLSGVGLTSLLPKQR